MMHLQATSMCHRLSGILSSKMARFNNVYTRRMLETSQLSFWQRSRIKAVSSAPSAGSEERIQSATTSIEDLSDMFKDMLSSNTSQQNSIEGLAYASLQPKVKESLASDNNFLKILLKTLGDAPTKSPLTYGALSILVNLTNYLPALSEE